MCQQRSSSTIDCEDQRLRENVHVSGTPYDSHVLLRLDGHSGPAHYRRPGHPRDAPAEPDRCGGRRRRRRPPLRWALGRSRVGAGGLAAAADHTQSGRARGLGRTRPRRYASGRVGPGPDRDDVLLPPAVRRPGPGIDGVFLGRGFVERRHYVRRTRRVRQRHPVQRARRRLSIRPHDERGARARRRRPQLDRHRRLGPQRPPHLRPGVARRAARRRHGAPCGRGGPRAAADHGGRVVPELRRRHLHGPARRVDRAREHGPPMALDAGHWRPDLRRHRRQPAPGMRRRARRRSARSPRCMRWSPGPTAP